MFVHESPFPILLVSILSISMIVFRRLYPPESMQTIYSIQLLKPYLYGLGT